MPTSVQPDRGRAAQPSDFSSSSLCDSKAVINCDRKTRVFVVRRTPNTSYRFQTTMKVFGSPTPGSNVNKKIIALM